MSEIKEGGPAVIRMNQRRAVVGQPFPCPRCQSPVEVTEAMFRRRQYTCNSCETARAVDWAKRNRDKKRVANRRYATETSAQRAARTAKWRANHPEKRKAHQAVQTALRNGSLTKQPCMTCGTKENVHAHHDDYSKPLEVLWLCHAHHMEHHVLLRAREAS